MIGVVGVVLSIALWAFVRRSSALLSAAVACFVIAAASALVFVIERMAFG
jgi:hypothetical protein